MAAFRTKRSCAARGSLANILSRSSRAGAPRSCPELRGLGSEKTIGRRPMSQQNRIDLHAISADSHITEPPNCYIDHIEKKYRDTAPHMVRDTRPGESGEVFVVEGFNEPLAL